MSSKNALSRNVLGSVIALALAVICTTASAAPYYWTDWTSWDPSGGTASGVITPISGPVVNVTFDALNANGSHGSYLGVAGNYLWNPASTYQSAQVDNAPAYEGLQLVGTQNMTYRVTLSEPIKDPLMAVTTLGSGGDSARYVFDSPFTILSQGPTCCWGGGNDRLSQVGNDLIGWEGAGVIQFIGTYTTFSWTVPDPEYWHGFTFGIRTTERLEPSNDVPEPTGLSVLGIVLVGFVASRRRKN